MLRVLKNVKSLALVVITALCAFSLVVAPASAYQYYPQPLAAGADDVKMCDLSLGLPCIKDLEVDDTLTISYVEGQKAIITNKNLDGFKNLDYVMNRFDTYPYINGEYILSPGESVPDRMQVTFLSTGSGNISNVTDSTDKTPVLNVRWIPE